MYVHQVQLNRIPYYTQLLEIAMVIITKKSFLFFLTVYRQERKSYIVNLENIKKKYKKKCKKNVEHVTNNNLNQVLFLRAVRDEIVCDMYNLCKTNDSKIKFRANCTRFYRQISSHKLHLSQF